MAEQTPEQKAAAETKAKEEAAEKARVEAEQKEKKEADAKAAAAEAKRVREVAFKANVYEGDKHYFAGEKYKISGALAEKLKAFIE